MFELIEFLRLANQAAARSFEGRQALEVSLLTGGMPAVVSTLQGWLKGGVPMQMSAADVTTLLKRAQTLNPEAPHQPAAADDQAEPQQHVKHHHEKHGKLK